MLYVVYIVEEHNFKVSASIMSSTPLLIPKASVENDPENPEAPDK